MDSIHTQDPARGGLALQEPHDRLLRALQPAVDHGEPRAARRHPRRVRRRPQRGGPDLGRPRGHPRPPAQRRHHGPRQAVCGQTQARLRVPLLAGAGRSGS